MWTENPCPRTLSLAKFDFSSDGALTTRPIEPLPTHCFSMLLCGKPGSGKTSLLLNLVCRKNEYYNGVFDRVYLISPSQRTMSKDWFEELPEEQRFDEFTEENLSQIISQVTGSGDKVLIILDDCQNDLKANIRPLLRMQHNRRHICGGKGSVSVIITAQVMNKIPLPLRKSFTHIITFPFSSKREQMSVFEDYINLSKEDWEALCRTTFQNPHDFMMVDLGHNKYYRNFSELTNQDAQMFGVET